MSDIAAAAQAPIGWAKARPVVFVLMVLLVACLAMKYRAEILKKLVALPLVGDQFSKFFGIPVVAK